MTCVAEDHRAPAVFLTSPPRTRATLEFLRLTRPAEMRRTRQVGRAERVAQ